MILSCHKLFTLIYRGLARACLLILLGGGLVGSGLIGGGLLGGQLALAEAPQLRWAGDVPIMQGWEIEPELGFAFDSPNGRIVMIFASSAASEDAIMAFYGKSLAQLGWTGGAGNWSRDAEKLVIGKVETARGPLWRLMLQPR
jgi:hypothetical protein